MSRMRSSTPALSPVPVPVEGCFDRMPAGISSTRRRSLSLSRAVHVMCVALNFWHSGGVLCKFEQPPHRLLYRRIRAFIKSDGLSGVFDTLPVGRRNPEIIARLGEVTQLLTMLGCSMSPYSKVFAAMTFPRTRGLNPQRLFLTGRGHWDITEFLGDELVMAYREPECLRVHRKPASWEFPRVRDSQQTVGELARIWDRQGLLMLHRSKTSSRKSFELVRIFNCYKSQDKDRQIGDRRGRNAIEGILHGPSANLPAGQDLCDLLVDLKSQRLHVSISDRRDFYHQLWVTKARALSNTLGPGLPVSLVEDTQAYRHYLLGDAQRKYSRERHGDRLDVEGDPRLRVDDELIWASFRSVLQGDHGGVEMATDAHTQLLQQYGLLREAVQLVANRPCRSTSAVEGLVIDDFFSVSVDSKEVPGESSESFKAYQKAQEAYQDYDLIGSPEKDVVAMNEGKVIGAYINCSDSAVKQGVCTVGPPAAKRLTLSMLTLTLCALPYTTVSLRRCVVGAWVSMLLYRRPMKSLLNASFALVETWKDASETSLIPLPREVAQELVMVAALAPLMLSDIAVPFDEKVYATDASESRGAICETTLKSDIAQILFKTCRTKGAYTRLQADQSSRGLSLENDDEDHHLDPEGVVVGAPRPLAYSFEFWEIYAGSSRISKALSALGVVVGPPWTFQAPKSMTSLMCTCCLGYSTFLNQVGC